MRQLFHAGRSATDLYKGEQVLMRRRDPAQFCRLKSLSTFARTDVAPRDQLGEGSNSCARNNYVSSRSPGSGSHIQMKNWAGPDNPRALVFATSPGNLCQSHGHVALAMKRWIGAARSPGANVAVAT